MVVKTTTKVADKTPDQIKAAPQLIKLELARIHRYHYGGTLYLTGVIYEFDPEDAQHMLGLADPQGVPVFMAAKKRTKMVQVEVEVPIKRSAVPTRFTSDLETFAATGGDLSKAAQVKAPQPQNMIDLSDDDPEIAAKLARADADEIDTGMGVNV